MTQSVRSWLGTVAMVGAVLLPAAALSPQASLAAEAAAPHAPQQSKQAEAQIARLHQDLDITPAQQSDFDALAAAIRDGAGKVDAAYETTGNVDPAKLAAPQVLSGYATVVGARAEAAQATVAPFGKLYDDLSAAQKAKADKLFRNFVRRQHS